jgi:hypothetical protein
MRHTHCLYNQLHPASVKGRFNQPVETNDRGLLWLGRPRNPLLAEAGRELEGADASTKGRVLVDRARADAGRWYGCVMCGTL